MTSGHDSGRPPIDPIAEEFQFHFRATIDDLVARGATREDALAEAQRRFGDRDGWRLAIQALHDPRPGIASRLSHTASTLRRDLRDGWRSLRRAPGLAAMTVLTLAIGLGGTAAMFAAVNAAFLKPLPFPDEHTLVKIYQGGTTRSDIRVALGVVQDWHRDSRTCSAIGGYLSGLTANVSGGEEALRARVSRITKPFFAAVGIAPALGRLWSDDEIVAGAPPVVVISHRLWQRAFAGRADVLRQELIVDATPVPIVGVMPEGFSFPDDTDMWTAVEREGPTAYGSRTAHNFTVVARLSPGATLGAVERELTALTEVQKQRFAEMAKENLRVVVTPLRTDLVGSHASMVWLGLGAVIGLLLVACVNVANLMLTRSLSRESETGIRVALGASRAAIGRAVLVEGVILAAGGAAVGIVFALWVLGGISALTPEAVTGGQPLSIDLRVLALTALATAGAGLLSALLPAMRASRTDPRQTLADAGRTLAASPRRAMNGLVGVEVALAFTLLFGAAILTESHARLDGVDSGFRQRDLILARVSLGLVQASPYGTPAARRSFYERLESAVATQPGVKGIGLAAIMPPGFSPNGRFVIEGRSEDSSGAHFRLVGGDYFRVMGIPLKQGRLFTPDDDGSRPQVAIINESLARSSFSNVDPIGQIVSMPGMDGGSGVATIVGIVGDVRHRGPSQPPVPEAYFQYRQRPWRTYSMTLVVESAIGATATSALIRSQVRAIDPLVAPELSSMEAEMAPFVAPSAFRAKLLLIVAAIALALALVGIAGVVSHVAARRRREMGIRAALGARPRSLTGLVIASGMRPVLAGALCGLIASLASAQLLSALTFGVSARDPRSLVAAAGAILATGLLASWWPARRSSHVDPASVLRQ